MLGAPPLKATAPEASNMYLLMPVDIGLKGKVTAKKLQARCFHVLRKGVLKSTALTTTLSVISTSASTSTNFTGRRSAITSDGSGRRNAPLWKQKYQRPTRPPVLLPQTAPTVCLVAEPSRQGSVAGLRNRWRTSFSNYFLLVKRLGARCNNSLMPWVPCGTVTVKTYSWYRSFLMYKDPL